LWETLIISVENAKDRVLLPGSARQRAADHVGQLRLPIRLCQQHAGIEAALAVTSAQAQFGNGGYLDRDEIQGNAFSVFEHLGANGCVWREGIQFHFALMRRASRPVHA